MNTLDFTLDTLAFLDFNRQKPGFFAQFVLGSLVVFNFEFELRCPLANLAA